MEMPTEIRRLRRPETPMDLQQGRASSAVARAVDRRVVACCFGELTKLAPQPPGNRVEPVQAAVQLRQKNDRTICPLDVRLFVSDHCLQLLG